MEIRGFIERAERFEASRAALANDLRGVYAEARAAGYDPQALRRIVAMRRKPDHLAIADVAIKALEGRRLAELRLAEALAAQDPQATLELDTAAAPEGQDDGR